MVSPILNPSKSLNSSSVLLSGDDDLYAGEDFNIDLSGDLRPDLLGESDLRVGEDDLCGLVDFRELLWLVIEVLVKLVFSVVVGDRVDLRNSWDILSLLETMKKENILSSNSAVTIYG